MEKIVEKDAGSVILSQEKRVIYLTFKGDISDEDYRNIWEVFLQTATEKNIKSVIIDQRNIRKVNMKVRAWLLTNWIPRAKRKFGNDFSGAVLSSKSVIHKAGINYLASGIQKLTSFNIKFVNSIEEGEEWLLEVETV